MDNEKRYKFPGHDEPLTRQQWLDPEQKKAAEKTEAAAAAEDTKNHFTS